MINPIYRTNGCCILCTPTKCQSEFQGELSNKELTVKIKITTPCSGSNYSSPVPAASSAPSTHPPGVSVLLARPNKDMSINNQTIIKRGVSRKGGERVTHSKSFCTLCLSITHEALKLVLQHICACRSSTDACSWSFHTRTL